MMGSWYFCIETEALPNGKFYSFCRKHKGKDITVVVDFIFAGQDYFNLPSFKFHSKSISKLKNYNKITNYLKDYWKVYESYRALEMAV